MMRSTYTLIHSLKPACRDVNLPRRKSWESLSLDSLVGKYRAIFTCLEGKRSVPSNAFVMSLDAEWHESGGRNNVLSYQVATLSRTAVNNVIKYVERGQRLSLEELVEIGIRSIHGGEIPDKLRGGYNKVLLVAHHVSAEWSVLRDRMEPHILSNLTVIRKSPVTGRNMITVEIGDGITVYVKIVDSRLLAPAGYQGLKKLSSLLGSDKALKLDVPNYYKANMHLFRRRHPQRYEAYSLQDSAVTLKVYLLLLDSLIKLSGKDGKRGRAHIFRTLASGAVTGFLRKHPAVPDYIKRLKEDEYVEPLKLFRRGYHGGRNEGFLLGRSDRHPELDGRLWVDIDFCGCYPTAMATVPAIANGINPLAEYIILPPETPGDLPRRKLLMEGPKLPVRNLPLRYHLIDRTDEEILDEGIAPANYRRVKAITDELNAIPGEVPADEAVRLGPDELKQRVAELYRQRVIKHKEFDAALMSIRAGGDADAQVDPEVLKRKRGTKTNREQAKRLRELAAVKDNRLVDEWCARAENAKGSDELHLIAGAARVRFKFPDDTLYPTLPVSHPAYGLVFPLRGECVATAIEIVTARAAGAEIEALCSVEMPAQYGDEPGLPRRPFFKHLKDLTKARDEYKKQIKEKKLPAAVIMKARVMEQLTKEYSNSFYGKTAQSIRYRRAYGPSTGEMFSLGPSQITEAITGSLTTGLPRAALGAVLVAIERYNKRQKGAGRKILVASATTDGLLVALPRPSGEFRTETCYTWEPSKGLVLQAEFEDVEKVLKLCGCSGLMKEMTKFLAIRQMRASRLALTGKPTFLEVKNLADHAAFVKTRGQLGWIDYTAKRRPPYNAGRAFTITAKFGLKPPISDIVAEGVDVTKLSEWRRMLLDQRYIRLYEGPATDRNTVEGAWVLRQLDNLRDANDQATPIFTYPFYTLAGFNELVKNEGDELDLTQKVSDRQLNADFDWKRKLEIGPDGKVLPFSRPYLNITEMLAHRSQMQEERRWGRNALPETVLHRVKVRGRRSSSRHGEAAAVTRTFIRLMVSKHLPGARLGARVPKRLNQVWTELKLTKQVMAPKTKMVDGVAVTAPRPAPSAWTLDNVKYAKRAKLEFNVIRPTLPLLKLAAALAREFKVDADRVKALIFAAPFDEEINPQLAELVARAVLHGPRRGLEPFRSLYLENRLPTKAGLVQAFHPYLTDATVEACAREDFHAGEGASWERPRLTRLFRRLGLKTVDAEACAKVLVLPARTKDKLPANPAHKRCLESFVHALHQPDIVPRPIKAVEVLDKLQPFGLKRHRYFSLRHSKFAPRCLTDTASNRRQINRMAKALRLDPEPLLEALLDR